MVEDDVFPFREHSISLTSEWYSMCSDASVTIEDVLLSVTDKVGPENISAAFRMNKVVVVFLKKEAMACNVVESSLFVRDT